MKLLLYLTEIETVSHLLNSKHDYNSVWEEPDSPITAKEVGLLLVEKDLQVSLRAVSKSLTYWLVSNKGIVSLASETLRRNSFNF